MFPSKVHVSVIEEWWFFLRALQWKAMVLRMGVSCSLRNLLLLFSLVMSEFHHYVSAFSSFSFRWTIPVGSVNVRFFGICSAFLGNITDELVGVLIRGFRHITNKYTVSSAILICVIDFMFQEGFLVRNERDRLP